MQFHRIASQQASSMAKVVITNGPRYLVRLNPGGGVPALALDHPRDGAGQPPGGGGIAFSQGQQVPYLLSSHPPTNPAMNRSSARQLMRLRRVRAMGAGSGRGVGNRRFG